MPTSAKQVLDAAPRGPVSFTPGPWFAMGAAVFSEDPNAFKPGTPLQEVGCFGDDGDEPAQREQVANARLAAAAPELLWALQDAEDLLGELLLNADPAADTTECIVDTLARARDALTKAEGR